jgi:L-fucose isomerase-like protein
MKTPSKDNHHHHCGCSVSGCCGVKGPDVSRRQFLAGAGALTLGGAMLYRAGSQTAIAAPAPARRIARNKPLRIQPVLVYEHYQYREATSWRPWSGLITEEHAEAERQRIRGELDAMTAKADFALEMLPLVSVHNAIEAKEVAAQDHDGVLIYGASGGTGIMIALADPAKYNLMFVRHRSGPAYLWYEIVHPRFLRRETDDYQMTGGMGVNDVIVDDHDEVLWRLRALHGLKNIKGKKIVAIGGAIGWDRGHGSEAPNRARELWGMEMVEVTYDEMSERIKAARADDALVRRCLEQSKAYLEQANVTLLPLQQQLTTEELVAGKGEAKTLDTMRTFVDNAFILTEVFRDLMEENDTDAITVGNCMGAIIPMSETTACLCLTILNDEGCLAFCESDFVVIPSGILLHYICNKPVFFCNPTFPHGNTVTVAHCTAPRKMDGQNLEPMHIRTHFESDYGAAPKVALRPGQEMTVLVPDFASERWMGFEGVVEDNPALDICTTQTDLKINGDGKRLVDEMRGFHWMTCYGNYLREVGYVLEKSGVGWLNISQQA